VLRITTMRMHYRLTVDPAGGPIDDELIGRVLASYADKCPAYQSVKGCISCSWDLEVVAAE